MCFLQNAVLVQKSARLSELSGISQQTTILQFLQQVDISLNFTEVAVVAGEEQVTKYINITMPVLEVVALEA